MIYSNLIVIWTHIKKRLLKTSLTFINDVEGDTYLLEFFSNPEKILEFINLILRVKLIREQQPIYDCNSRLL